MYFHHDNWIALITVLINKNNIDVVRSISRMKLKMEAVPACFLNANLLHRHRTVRQSGKWIALRWLPQFGRSSRPTPPMIIWTFGTYEHAYFMTRRWLFQRVQAMQSNPGFHFHCLFTLTLYYWYIYVHYIHQNIKYRCLRNFLLVQLHYLFELELFIWTGLIVRLHHFFILFIYLFCRSDYCIQLEQMQLDITK